MDIQDPEQLVPAQAPPAPPPVFRDRSTGLTVYGIIQIVVGLLAAMFVPLSLVGAIFARKMNSDGALPLGYYAQTVFTYTLFATILITLGIGSIRARRWARDLCLILSWVWLLFGTFTTLLLAVVLPSSLMAGFKVAAEKNPQATPLPAGCSAVIVTLIIAFTALFTIVLPILLVVFYRKNDVRETCRHRDTKERWTERLPLPLLAACLLFGYGSVYYLLSSVTIPFVPFFGKYLTGIPAGIVSVVFALVDFVIAVLLYQRQIAGWWIAIGDLLLRGSAIATTIGRANLLDAYARMGWSSKQLAMIEMNPMYRSGAVLWIGLAAVLAGFAYLIWVRRFVKVNVAQ